MNLDNQGQRPAVVVDCDPGQDDAVALVVAMAMTDLLGVTITYGNCSVETGVQNALDVLSLAGRPNIPVSRGATLSLLGRAPAQSPIHGLDGLGGIKIPKSQASEDGLWAWDFIYQTVTGSTEPVNVVALGPLTNIALSLLIYPDLKERIAGIYMMGGSLTFGNVTPVAEFNIHSDPEAARIVFKAGIPIRMCGLNVTRYANISEEAEQDLAKDPSPLSQFLSSLIRVRRSRLKKAYGFDLVSLHDPCAVFALTCPKLFTFEAMAVDVETGGDLTRGMTVCDRRPGSKTDASGFVQPRTGPFVEVATGIEAAFEEYLIKTIKGITK